MSEGLGPELFDITGGYLMLIYQVLRILQGDTGRSHVVIKGLNNTRWVVEVLQTSLRGFRICQLDDPHAEQSEID